MIVDPDGFQALVAEPTDELSWKSLAVAWPLASGEALAAFCQRQGIAVLDQLDGQIAELARVRYPGANQAAARQAFAAERTSAGPRAYGGVWMYFHWLRRLVRVLDRNDYFDVITSRNHDKITRQEQAELRAKTVGIVGLSVGGEIACTIAQEHLCGRIKVADFDDLELSNLNRLGSGVDDLGVNKALLVARRIAVMDPWLDVEVFPTAIDEDNADEFLSGLDLVLDECDGLAMKFRLRELARERRINLLYGADERGMLSVEPYAHVDCPIFHGIVKERQPPREAYPNDVEFFKALTEWLGGWDVISERTRQSLLRVGTDLAGFPQLAGEPRFAAGQIAHAARRLLLGEALPPFLGFQDLDEFIPTVDP